MLEGGGGEAEILQVGDYLYDRVFIVTGERQIGQKIF